MDTPKVVSAAGGVCVVEDRARERRQRRRRIGIGCRRVDHPVGGSRERGNRLQAGVVGLHVRTYRQSEIRPRCARRGRPPSLLP
ncbi:hypothetical protein Q1M63_28700 [Sinorhizobium meliloti]|nr:hypothetical protein Q1M63_28700 [Sinorhizobium meliloti]